MAEATADMPLSKDGTQLGTVATITSAAATTIATAEVAVKAAGTYAKAFGSAESGFAVDVSGKAIDYSNRETRDVWVDFTGSVTVASGDDDVTVDIYAGGAAALTQTVSSSSSVSAFAIKGLVEIEAGESIEIYLTNEDTTANLTLGAGMVLAVHSA